MDVPVTLVASGANDQQVTIEKYLEVRVDDIWREALGLVDEPDAFKGAIAVNCFLNCCVPYVGSVACI